MRSLSAPALIATLLLAGCASGPPFIDQAQPEAVAIAQRRAAFEFSCPNTTAQVLSRETLQPVSFRFGIERAEYPNGARGCGTRATHAVTCPHPPGSTCSAAAARDGIQ
jgi:hypothetical protein